MKSLNERVTTALTAHRVLERLVQAYYENPSLEVAEQIYEKAKELRKAWNPPVKED